MRAGEETDPNRSLAPIESTPPLGRHPCAREFILINPTYKILEKTETQGLTETGQRRTVMPMNATTETDTNNRTNISKVTSIEGIAGVLSIYQDKMHGPTHILDFTQDETTQLYRFLKLFAEQRGFDIEKPPQEGDFDYVPPEPVSVSIRGRGSLRATWAGGVAVGAPDGYRQLEPSEIIELGDVRNFKDHGHSGWLVADHSIGKFAGRIDSESTFYRPVNGITMLPFAPKGVEWGRVDSTYFVRNDDLEQALASKGGAE